MIQRAKGNHGTISLAKLKKIPPQRLRELALIGLGRENFKVKRASDERVRQLELTAKGRKVAADLDTGSRRKFAGILKRMTAKEKQAVLHGLEMLNTAISTKESSS